MRPGPPIAAATAALALAGLAALWLARAPAERAPDAARPAGEIEDGAAPSAAEFVEVAGGEPEGRAPAAAAIEQPEAERAVAAPGASAVAGRLRLAGGPPGEAVELVLARQDRDDENSSWSHVQQVASALDGNFRFEGLPADWSGAVLLPQHYRLAGIQDSGMRARVFPARAGDLGLALDVERLPTLRGRILGATDRTPVSDVSVGFQADWGSVRTMTSAPTDAQGRFRLPLRQGTLLGLSLSCRTEEGAFVERAWDASTLPAPDARGDVELGDLFLAPARIAELLVLGPSGAPFEGARAVERGTREGRVSETDVQGRAELQLPDALEGFDVRADGYSLVELPRPAPGEEIVVRLQVANRLAVEVVDESGRPWPHGRLRLKAAQPAFEGGREVPADAPTGPGPTAGSEWGHDREGAYAIFRTDLQGRIEWQGLRTHLALEITLEDALGTPAAHAVVPALAAGEQRSLRLQLGRAPLSVGGRCVDAAGNSIAGARVRISAAKAGSTELECDGDGNFHGPPLLAERVRLRASAAGFADLEVPELAPPAELTLQLERARTLQVTLRDAAGTPIEVGELLARAGASGTRWNSQRNGPGRYEFEGVAWSGIEVEHTWHGRSRSAPVPDGAEEFVLELPTLGRLEVEVAPCAIGELESGYLLLEALDGRSVVQQQLLPPGESALFRFDPWPGRYRLRRVVQSFTADADGWRTPAGSREIGQALEVEVDADRIAQAELEGVP